MTKQIHHFLDEEPLMLVSHVKESLMDRPARHDAYPTVGHVDRDRSVLQTEGAKVADRCAGRNATAVMRSGVDPTLTRPTGSTASIFAT